MLAPDNPYSEMQRAYYNATADGMATSDHRGHDANPDYHGILLKQVTDNPSAWSGKRALDFGCGTGRNVDNLLSLARWARVDGCDISQANVDHAIRLVGFHHDTRRFDIRLVSGIDLKSLESSVYDFVMATIVLQHIAVWDIRWNLLREIFRVMKPGGIFSFQMAIYPEPLPATAVVYHANVWDAQVTNGGLDVSVNNPEWLVTDLSNLGFEKVSYQVRPAWDYVGQRYAQDGGEWLFVQAWKPANTFSTFLTA